MQLVNEFDVSINSDQEEKGLKYYLQQLFESGIKFDMATLMVSNEFKNIIRDNNQIICFLENQIQNKEFDEAISHHDESKGATHSLNQSSHS